MPTESRAKPHPVSALAGVALVLAWLVGPLVAAGTARWREAWLYYAVALLGNAAHRAYVRRHNPALIARRKNIGPGTKKWDLRWLAAFWPLMVSIPIVAGLDTVRFRWSLLPPESVIAGVAVFGVGMVVGAWAMGINPFFEGTVRIQHDVGQYVVDTGPYRRVRHPGYVALILWALGTPLMLRSAWAFVPAAATAAWLVLRTALEDRTLKEELSGYREYTARVRYRLVPGVW